MNILFTSEALERLQEIERSDPKSARIILNHIKKLPVLFKADPFLKGEAYQGLRRNRTGRYRIIYRALEKEQSIRIITLDHRKSIYE